MKSLMISRRVIGPEPRERGMEVLGGGTPGGFKASGTWAYTAP
jgi:hypothetical protein